MRTLRFLLVIAALSGVTATASAQATDPFRVGLWGIFCDFAPGTEAQWQTELNNFASLNANYLEACISDVQMLPLLQRLPQGTQVTITDNPLTGEPSNQTRLSRWIRYSASIVNPSTGALPSSWTTTANQIIDQMRNAYGGMAGMGYYMAAHENLDLEVGWDTLSWPGLRYVLNRIHAVDPNHRSMVVGYEGSITDAGTYNFHCGAGCELTLAQFAQRFPRLGVYHLDTYIWNDATPSTYASQQDRLNYYVATYNNAMNAFVNGYTRWRVVMQTQDGTGGAPAHLRRPTLEEIRAQAYLALSRGSNGVLAYLYSRNGTDETGLVAAGTHAPLQPFFSNVASVLGEVRQLGPVLERARVRTAFPRTSIPTNNTAGIKTVSGSDVEIGVFEDAQSRDYFMLVNRRLNDASGALFPAQTITVTLAGNVGLQDQRNAQFVARTYNSSANTTAFNVTLAPGRGELFEVIYAPAPPTNLSITNAGQIGAAPRLSWTASSTPGVTYAIERMQKGATVSPWQEIARISSTTYTDRNVIQTSLANKDFTYYYQVRAVHASGATSAPTSSVYVYGDPAASVQEAGVTLQHEAGVPAAYALSQNYPNPFNPQTQIRFSLPEATSVSLLVYDSLGRLVGEIVNGSLEAGDHAVTWNAAHLPSGVYFYHLRAGAYSSIRQMLLLK